MVLALDHARLRFGGIVALDDVSLEVEDRSIVGLIGPNGAGKTTAFNAITRLYRLDSGDIVFDGRSLKRTRPSRVIRLGIARTFQNLELFPRMTVLENVLVGAHPATRLQREREQRRHALETLADVGIADHAGVTGTRSAAIATTPGITGIAAVATGTTVRVGGIAVAAVATVTGQPRSTTGAARAIGLVLPNLDTPDECGA